VLILYCKYVFLRVDIPHCSNSVYDGQVYLRYPAVGAPGAARMVLEEMSGLRASLLTANILIVFGP
jgi:hypothetical protein